MLRLLRTLPATAWAFLVTLWLPLTVVITTLKSLRLRLIDPDLSFLAGLDLLKSDLLVLTGFLILGLCLLRLARAGWPRKLTLGALQLCAAYSVPFEIAADHFFHTTGSALDIYLVLHTAENLEEVWPVVRSEVPLWVMALMALGALLAMAIPWVMREVIERWQRRAQRDGSTSPTLSRGRRAALCLGLLLSCSMIWASSSLPPLTEAYGYGAVRNATVHITTTGLQFLLREDSGAVSREPLTRTELVERQPRPARAPRHVVIILLESTRARSTSLYNDKLETTPFLKEIAPQSLVAERAYAVVPHTSKALVSTLCGIEPRLNMPITEARPGSIPANCLAKLLRERGYATAFMQSAVSSFENRAQLVENMGYETFRSVERMSKRGFERANYFGYEDDVMLKPSRRWLEKQKRADRPLLLTYLTLTPHHDYKAPRRYGRHKFDKHEELNRYLNAVRYVDQFSKNVIEMFKELGLYEDTLFVILGDHGEGFGEHGRRQHDNVIYQEGLRIPMVLHHPRSLKAQRLQPPVNQLDLLPTIVHQLGYDVKGGDYPGQDLREAAPERQVRAHCWYERRCMASIGMREKTIYHFGSRQDELFDLEHDPHERVNLARDRDLSQTIIDLQRWRDSVIGMHRDHSQSLLSTSVFEEPQTPPTRLDGVVYGGAVKLLGIGRPTRPVQAGEEIEMQYYFEVLGSPGPGWKLVIEARQGKRTRRLRHVPVEGLYPVSDWEKGKFIIDRHRFRLPRSWRGKPVALYMSFEHKKTGRATIKSTAKSLEVVDDQVRLLDDLQIEAKPK